MNKLAFKKAHSRQCRALEFQDLPFEENVDATETEIRFDPHFEAN